MSADKFVRSLLVSAVLLAPMLHSARALACTYAVVVIETTYPAEGAVNVPTNAVPFVYGSDIDSADDVELFDDAGNPVPIEVRMVDPSGMDLVPLTELTPNHRYELRAVGQIEAASIEFTTGTGPAEVPTVVEQPTLDVRLFDYDSFSSCGEHTGICLETTHAPDTMVEVRVGDEVLRPGAEPHQPQYRAYGQSVAMTECVEVRARDVRGNRSAPVVACGDALDRVRLSGDMPDSGYTCDNYTQFAESSSGCTLGGSAMARSDLGLLVLGVAVLAAARRQAGRAK